MHPPIDDRQPNEVLRGSALVGGSHTPEVDDTEAVYSQVYSRFGLSFLKPFLVGKGANPVLYVAINSPALSFGLPGSRSGYDLWPRRRVFEDYRQKMHDAFPLTLRFFLDMLVFSFIKYFDDSTSDEDESNVYMEREWRVLGDVNFALADVHRVFMPERYAERFRADLPNYTGRLLSHSRLR